MYVNKVTNLIWIHHCNILNMWAPIRIEVSFMKFLKQLWPDLWKRVLYLHAIMQNVTQCVVKWIHIKFIPQYCLMYSSLFKILK